MCAPNLFKGDYDLRLDLRPPNNGKAQLTWDDAINFDHGLRMGHLTFDREGNRLLPEATHAEREHMRRYNWLMRKGHPTTVKAELATVCDQIDRWPANREAEWTIPQGHVTLALGPTKFVTGPLEPPGNLYVLGAGTRQNERPGQLGRSAVFAEQPELYGTLVQAASVTSALIVFLPSLGVWPVPRRGPSASAL